MQSKNWDNKKLASKLQIAILLTIQVASAAHAIDWASESVAAEKAWTITKGSSDIVVAVIDTGMDAGHPLLKDTLWTNPKEIQNGKDDDGNGLIDDLHGWDFTENKNTLTDRHGHGTHIAGIIHKVAPNVKLMILKYYDPNSPSSQNLNMTLKAFDYAVKMNVNIINYSGGGMQRSAQEEALIKDAKAKSILVVAAAGNEHTNSDVIGFYPAAYGLENIVSVTAIDSKSQKVSSSNFGTRTVDIAAPGQQIMSTLPGGRIGPMTGTSQATAYVTGIAALVMSQQKNKRDIAQIKKQLASSNTPTEALRAQSRWGVSANGYKALVQKEAGLSAFHEDLQNVSEDLNSLFSNKAAPDNL